LVLVGRTAHASSVWFGEPSFSLLAGEDGPGPSLWGPRRRLHVLGGGRPLSHRLAGGLLPLHLLVHFDLLHPALLGAERNVTPACIQDQAKTGELDVKTAEVKCDSDTKKIFHK
jgi:hypothetical protein